MTEVEKERGGIRANLRARGQQRGVAMARQSMTGMGKGNTRTRLGGGGHRHINSSI